MYKLIPLYMLTVKDWNMVVILYEHHKNVMKRRNEYLLCIN